MSLDPTCGDCESAVSINFEPYGSSLMAVIDCPTCGISYDTNLDPEDVKAIPDKTVNDIIKEIKESE